MENLKFENISNEQLENVEGGSISLGAALLIAACGTMIISAGVSAFNGYQEAKRENEGEDNFAYTL